MDDIVEELENFQTWEWETRELMDRAAREISRLRNELRGIPPQGFKDDHNP